MFIQFQWYVAATIGFAHLNYQQFEIPALLRKANRYTHLTYHEKQPFLHKFFQSLLEVQTGSAHPGGWPNAWWEELSTASFPELTYQHHQERQRRLVERLLTLHNITQKVLDKNSEHLASRASEIIQLMEGSEVIKRNVLERLGEEMTLWQMDTE
ncbi:hypothetical protein PILCRDRAFT_17438 [Piloderma croceum F 1598]|uniref:Uncharacterized protein n=1 Tax=Piloderma croceum (strain F 1598) TaxID=765440 RepID=A0A0C3ETB2_PILCF|nr:hypothetical protein PILCRDRAFT_17438 [Piloderma croceum F 1598]